MSDLIVSYIRTGVPIAVGSALGWLLTLGIELDAETQAALITGVTGASIAAYYAIARLIERRWPKVGGVLLGKKAEVTYTAPSSLGRDGEVQTVSYPQADPKPGQHKRQD